MGPIHEFLGVRPSAQTGVERVSIPGAHGTHELFALVALMNGFHCKFSIMILTALLAVTVASAGPVVRQGRSECGVRHWTSPKRIGRDRDKHVARFPSIAAFREDVYVVGNDIPLFDRSHVSSRSLTIWDMQHGGSLMEGPAGVYDFIYPKAVVDSKRRFHLFWGESSLREPVEAFRWGTAPITSIWWATYVRKSGWSKPQRVLSGSRLDWSPNTSSKAIIRENGDIIFALPSDRTGVRKLFHTGRSRWRTTSVPANGSYASLAGTRTHLFLAYADAVKGVGTDVNSVFLLESQDDGSRWKPPVLVSRSGMRGAYEIHLVSFDDGSLHLLWVQDVGHDTSVIRHVSRRDAASPWSSAQDLSINAQPGTAALAVSPDQCAGIHVLYQDWRKGPEEPRLAYAYWNAGWSAPQSLFPAYRASEAVLGKDSGGKLLLLFLGQQAATKDSSGNWTMYARGNR